MKAIVNTAVGLLEWADVPTPEPGPGQVRIRTAACGICATDVEMIDGDPRTTCPAILGHEWSGTVDTVGREVDRSLLGKPCVASNVLAAGGEVGFEHPGGYGQFLVTDAANVRPLPPGFWMPAAALIEPLAVCVHGLSRMDPHPDADALVLGDGPIGLLMVCLLAREAERVVLVGGRDHRLALAARLGAAEVVNYHLTGPNLAQTLGHFGTVVEASGSPAAMTTALACAARRAKVLLLGDYGSTARADFAWNDLLHNQWELIGSDASDGASWDRAVALATGGIVPLERLVTHTLPARRFAEGMALVRSRASEAVKVVLNWQGDQ